MLGWSSFFMAAISWTIAAALVSERRRGDPTASAVCEAPDDAPAPLEASPSSAASWAAACASALARRLVEDLNRLQGGCASHAAHVVDGRRSYQPTGQTDRQTDSEDATCLMERAYCALLTLLTA
jgi:hypothetical protein